MSNVKPDEPRRTRREANLEATRTHIAATAARLFLSQGYGRTTIADIAREAGVAVQTLYNTVGPKSAILSRVFEASAAGPQAPRAVPDFMQERTRAISDAPGIARLLADWFAEAHPRMGPLWRVIEEAAAQDGEVARFAVARAHRRLDNYRKAAEALAERGGIPDGLDLDDAAALIWAVGHPQVYRTLVEERGWSPERYRRWVEATLGAAIARP